MITGWGGGSTFYAGFTFATGCGRVVGVSPGQLSSVHSEHHQLGLGIGWGSYWSSRGYVLFIMHMLHRLWFNCLNFTTGPRILSYYIDRGDDIAWHNPCFGSFHQADSVILSVVPHFTRTGWFSRHFYRILAGTPILTVLYGLGLIDLPPLYRTPPSPDSAQISRGKYMERTFLALSICDLAGHHNWLWI